MRARQDPALLEQVGPGQGPRLHGEVRLRPDRRPRVVEEVALDIGLELAFEGGDDSSAVVARRGSSDWVLTVDRNLGIEYFDSRRMP